MLYQSELNEEQLQNQENQSTVFISSKLPQKNYCSLCKKSFSTQGNLRNHIMTIHENNRPFKCPFPGCTKNYSIQSRLQVHYRTHTGNKPFICKECGKAFNEKGNLKTHERFHSEQRPFKCNYCNKTYKTNGHLKDHIEIQHMKIRKFICSYCNKKFGRISTLKAHIRTHTGEKNYKCKIEGCNKCFAEKGNMEIHYKRHLKRIMNQKNYNCNSNNNNINYNNNNYINCNYNNNNNLNNDNDINDFNKNNTFNLNEFSTFDDNTNITRPSSKLTLLNNNNIFSDNNNKEKIIDDYYQNNFLLYEPGNTSLINFNINYNDNENKDYSDLPEKDDLSYLDALPELNFDVDKAFANI